MGPILVGPAKRNAPVVDAATRVSAVPEAESDLFDGPDNPLVRISALVSALRRRRRVWIVAALVGMLASLAYFVTSGPEYSATTTLILRRSTITSQDPAQAMATDVQLAQSLTVAGRALNLLHLNESPAQFDGGYKAASLTEDILEITAEAPTSTEAVRRAAGVATAYLEFRGELLSREASVQIAAENQESNTLQAQIPGLDNQINIATAESSGGSAPSSSGTLADLLARRNELESQIGSVQQQSENLTADIAAVVKNSQVVDSPLASRPSTAKTAGLDLAVGLLGGLALGAGWVVVVEATFGRVRRREDVMLALDAPVRVSVGPLEPGRSGALRRLRSSRPPTGRSKRDVVKVARHLRDIMATIHEPTPALAVVSVDNDNSAALIAAETVRSLTGEGNDVLVVDLSSGACLAQTFGVGPNQVSSVDQGGSHARLWVVSRSMAEGSTIDDWMQLNNLRDETEAVVVLTTLDPAVGAGHLAALATTAVSVVTCGRSTVGALRATSQMLRAAGVRLDSSVLVGADPDDESFGGRAPAATRPPVWA